MPTTSSGAAPTIGFDLDMTLIDSRPGVKAVYDELALRTGVAIDSDLVVSRLGPPLERELANWFPAERVPEVADLYRSLYPDLAVAAIPAMTGAREALSAARERGATIAVITAKNAPDARRHLDHLGLSVDDVRGRAWREGKAQALDELGATIYVGDHVHDMEAAVLARITGIGVTTGPCSAADLTAAGAARVLRALTALPQVLDSLWPERAVS